MFNAHKYKLLTGVLLTALLWFAWPVYEFLHEQGKAPGLPIGFITLPEEAPSTQELSNPAFQLAGERALEELRKHQTRIHAPALSAAVAIRGELVWSGTVGWADVAARIPATPRTQFRIGSTSKAVTATGLARLVDAGVIDLDAPISTYITNLPNAQWQNITARQLASHTAGLPDYPDNRDWVGLYQTLKLNTHFDNVIDSLAVFDSSPLLYQPGTDFKYTTFSTVLLSAVMASASQSSYPTLMAEQVFKPLAVSATGPEPLTPGAALASFYWRPGDAGAQVKLWRKVDLSHRLAGGGLISTSSDLAVIGSAWLNDDFISPATRALFWTPQRLSSGVVNPQNYALGWRLHEGDEIPRNMNHGGISRGAQSWLMVFPEHQMAVAVNMNARTEEFWDFGSVAVTLAEGFLTQLEAASPPPSDAIPGE